jgi:hypothetical protein
MLVIGVHDGSKLRLYVKRVEIGTGTTISGFSPGTGPMRVGVRADGLASSHADKATVFGWSGGLGVPTAAEILQLFDDVERTGQIASIPAKTTVLTDLTQDIAGNGGAMPTTYADRIGTSPLTRVGTLEVSTDVATAPAAPLQLTDTATHATADAMVRNGLPTVRVIDPTIEGRRMLGAQGYSASSYFAAAIGAGIRSSAAGLFVAVSMRFDSLPAGNQTIAALCDVTTFYEWQFYQSGSLLRFFINDGVGGKASTSYTVVASDIGIPLLLIGQYTGTGVQLYVCRPGMRPVATGADTAASGVISAAAASAEMRIGGVNGLSQPFISGSVFALSGGSGTSMTLTEVTALYQSWEATGRLPVTSKTQHLYELTSDVRASGVEIAPAIVLDRVGTDHLTRIGFGAQMSGATFLGVGPYVNNTTSWKTALGGGIQGGPSMHVIADVYLTRIPTAAEHIVGCENGSGWYLFITAAGAIGIGIGGIGELGIYTLVPGDLNRTLRIVLNNINRDTYVWVNGVNTGHWNTGSFIATANAYMIVGQRFVGTQSLISGYVKLVQGGSSASLTDPEIATISADLTQPPPLTAGKTQKRYLFELDVVGGVVQGRSIERISGNDDLVLSGSGLTLAQRTERLWSYEGSPIEYAVNALTDADYYGSTDGVAGHAAGWWYAVPFVLESQAVASQTRVLAAKVSAAAGWELRTGGTNSTCSCVMANGVGTFIAGPTMALSASDVGKLLVAFIVWDGTKIRSYLKRLESGTGNAMTGYTPAAAGDGFRMGRHPITAALPASGVRLLGGMGGLGVLSLAEVQAAHDAVLAADDLVEVPGKTDFLVSVKLDTIAAGGAVPTTLTNRKGAGSVTKIGAPALAPIYARAAGW